MADQLKILDRLLAERSLADFVRQAWPILEPKTQFEENWHLDFIAEHWKRLPSAL